MHLFLQRLFFFVMVPLLLPVACREKTENPYRNVALEDYDSLCTEQYAVKEKAVRSVIAAMARADDDTLAADYFTRAYYRKGGCLVWVGRMGVRAQADTLLHLLDSLEQIGFNKRRFRVPQIVEDLRCVRQLAFTENGACCGCLGRLEYNLTKAFLRFALGERYGYVDPYRLLNRLELADTTMAHPSFRTLFDVPMERRNKNFFPEMLQWVKGDSIADFFRTIPPKGALYGMLKERLQRTGLNEAQRQKLLVNMERSRWRMEEDPMCCEKYVLVNIPSYHLRAVDGKEVLEMRIGCGAQQTKTPLLTSAIKRMDVNPQWIIPKSIVRTSVVKHVGDSAYFASHRYFVRERATGKSVPIRYVSAAMLLSPDYAVVQEGGEGNSLGRIIFRFDNKFAVFLHDTSSRDFFARRSRDVSHGCVRVEKPFELALFLLEKRDSAVGNKIRETMEEEVRRSYVLQKKVPLFITYFTLYPNPKGEMEEYADVYGYDKVIGQYLSNYR